MIALKTLRRDLGNVLAGGLGASHAPIGTNVHPPAIVVQSSSGDYVTAFDYCTDAVEFDVSVVAPPGDPAAVADALDDLIDQVRATLRPATATAKYQFRRVSGLVGFTSGDLTFPAVTVTVGVERVD